MFVQTRPSHKSIRRLKLLNKENFANQTKKIIHSCLEEGYKK